MKMKIKRHGKAVIGIASLLAIAGTSAFASPTRVRDFSLIDHLGDQYQLTRLGTEKAVVVISQANSCQDNIEQLPGYKLLRTTWEPMGVKFLMMNSARDDLKSIRAIANSYNIDFPIMLDDTQLVAESLDVTKAGEILVFDPKTSQLVYRGPLDITPNRRAKIEGTSDLADAITSIVDGKNSGKELVKIDVKSSEGCDFDFPVQAMHAQHVPDYAKDIAPILRENCTHCHVEGGIGPFAMNSYEMVRGWSHMMRQVVMTKRMPPEQVDPHINHFDNANYLSVADEQTLVHWIDAGAPRGDSKEDPLKSLKPLTSEWQLGEPDMIVEVPSFTVPATGVIDYFNNVIDLNFDEDKYIRAVQFVPGDKRVLHHLLAYAQSPENGEGVVAEESVRDFLEGYAPGKTDATVFPEGTGVFFPKGYKLVMQMHYTTIGQEVVDKTRVGLYFNDKKPKYKFLTKSVSHGGVNLALRPYEAEHKMNYHYVFDNDTMLYAMRPHMHYRGKAFRFSVVYPDGRRETLLNVPNYNFAWQPTYRLSKPIFLPAGSRVITDAVFDNSEYNIGNPDPSALVRGGPQTWDEMFIGYFTYIDLGTRTGEQQLSSN